MEESGELAVLLAGAMQKARRRQEGKKSLKAMPSQCLIPSNSGELGYGAGSHSGVTGGHHGPLEKDRVPCSLSKGSRWESSHRVNRKGITSKQPVNKYEIICPTGQFCPGLFTPKPACKFFPE